MKNVTAEEAEMVRVGNMADEFFKTPYWNELMKPVIDSFVKGLTDIRNLKSSDLSSEHKAKVEIAARKLAADYIGELETFIQGYVTDRDTTIKIMENRSGVGKLYKKIN